MVNKWKIYFIIIRMGNAADKGGNSLARNWKQAGPNSYRNLITGELIDCFDIVAHSEMEMQEHNSLLMKRAALAHPNVPKLIYFCNSESNTLCSLTSYKMKVYLEHVEGKEKGGGEGEGCVCCGVANGVRYLVERYGYFGISQDNLKVAGERKRKTIKVWINADMKSSSVHSVVSEQVMCKQIIQMLRKQTCRFVKGSQTPKNLQELFEFIYKSHNQQPVGHQNRKRVNSQQTVIESQVRGSNTSDMITASRQKYQVGNRIGLEVLKQDPIESRPSPIKKLQTRRLGSPKNREREKEKSLESQKDIFYRPIINPSPSFSKKVNFNYTNGLTTTPRNNRTFQPKVNASLSSPHPSQPRSVYLSKHVTSSNKTVKDLPRQPVLVSQFSRASDLLIEEEEEEKIQKLKELVQSQSKKSSASRKDSQMSSKKDVIKLQSADQVLNQKIYCEKYSEKSDVKKQMKLKLHKNEAVSFQNTQPQSLSFSQSTPDDTSSKRAKLTIGNTIRISVEPEPNNVENMPIDESHQYRDDTPQIEFNEPNFGTKEKLNFEQNATSMESRDRNDFSQEGLQRSTFKRQSRNTSYLNYLKQLDEIKRKDVQAYSPKAVYSDRIASQQFQRVSANTTQFYPVKPKLNKAQTEFNSAKYPKNQGEIESLYDSSDEQERKKAQIMERINSTEQVLRQNRKKLERLQLEKELEREKGLIAKEMESLLVAGNEESLRIKEKVKHKKATFAELKAEASKILQDLNF